MQEPVAFYFLRPPLSNPIAYRPLSNPIASSPRGDRDLLPRREDDRKGVVLGQDNVNAPRPLPSQKHLQCLVTDRDGATILGLYPSFSSLHGTSPQRFQQQQESLSVSGTNTIGKL